MTYAKKMKLYSNIHWHAASEREADQIKKQFGSGVSIRTIPMAPTTKNGFADKKAINERIKNSKSDELRLVYFGRLAPEKNLPFAFEILKQFCTKYPSQSIVYDLIGPCEIKYLEKLRSLSMNLPKNGQVNYIGHMSTGVLREHLGGTNTAAPNLFFYHALLMPSFTENFSYTVLESLQAGIPALISDQTPWRDLEAVGAGWDLPLDVPKLWLDALKRLSDDSLQATVSRSEEALRYSSSYTEDYSNLGSRLFAPNQKV
jgi:glycosyltransferase involved in cell wall biosynthesis